MVTSEVEMSADIGQKRVSSPVETCFRCRGRPSSTAGSRAVLGVFPPSTGQHSGAFQCALKTNADRQNLLESDFNDRLIERAASMVVDQLSSLSTAEDPARHLDYLPGRGRERRMGGRTGHLSRLRDVSIQPFASRSGRHHDDAGRPCPPSKSWCCCR